MKTLEWTSTRVRLISSALVGVATYLVTFALESESRILLSYDLAIVAYLAIFLVRMLYADGAATRDLAEKEEASNVAVLILAGVMSGLSLSAVGLMLHRSKLWTPLLANLHLGLSLWAVFLSWALLHVIFGIHYARMYYDPEPPAGEPKGRKILEFPVDDELPDFWDFMYFSFTLAICYQVSDISIRSRHLRRLVLAHVLLSFLNVTLILGLVVEIVSTLADPVAQRFSVSRSLGGALSVIALDCDDDRSWARVIPMFAEEDSLPRSQT